MNSKTERKCRSCGKHKNTIENYKMLRCGKRYTRCNDCVKSFKSRPKQKCISCYKEKTLKSFEVLKNKDLSNVCKNCKAKPKKPTVVVSAPKERNKKDDMIINRNIISYEMKNVQKINDLEIKRQNDLKEKELFNKGARFVKSTKHVRAYVLSR